MRHLELVVDGATARLIKIAQAVRASGVLPVSTSKTLVQLTKGVRLSAEARERAFASELLDDIEDLAQGCSQEEYRALQSMLLRHTTAVRKALAYNEKG